MGGGSSPTTPRCCSASPRTQLSGSETSLLRSESPSAPPNGSSPTWSTPATSPENEAAAATGTRSTATVKCATPPNSATRSVRCSTCSDDPATRSLTYGANAPRETKAHSESSMSERTTWTTRPFTVFVCECEDESCVEPVALTTKEYEAIRANSNSFFVIPGHETPMVDQVIEKAESYLVVRKRGSRRRRSPKTRPPHALTPVDELDQ